MNNHNPHAEFTTADFARRFRTLAFFGVLAEIDNTTHPPRARVKSGSEDDFIHSDFLPLPTAMGNNFRAWSPARTGTQCFVICPNGEINSAAIVALYHSDDLAQPSNNPNEDVIEFNDGTIIKKSADELLIDTPCKIKVSAEQDIIVKTTANSEVKAGGDIKVTAGGKVTITGGGGSAKGVVQGDCICPFTGAPHTMISDTVEASK